MSFKTGAIQFSLQVWCYIKSRLVPLSCLILCADRSIVKRGANWCRGCNYFSSRRPWYNTISEWILFNNYEEVPLSNIQWFNI